jgi:hypothetical protein
MRCGGPGTVTSMPQLRAVVPLPPGTAADGGPPQAASRAAAASVGTMRGMAKRSMSQLWLI